MNLFQELGLPEPLVRALQDLNFQNPTPVQAQAIPLIQQGNDLLGSAQTGTGKTAAFALPLLQRLAMEDKPAGKHPRALVLTPTRELAQQVSEAVRSYGKYLRVRHAVIYGGVSQRPQEEALRRGVDLVVATPGRLMDLLNQRILSLEAVRMVVLDEADQMLDMGFLPDMRRILRLIPQRQTLLFSATFSREILELAGEFLKDPQRVEVAHQQDTTALITQKVYFVDKDDKGPLLEHLLRGDENLQTLIFSRTKYGADRISKILTKKGILADAIHGDKTQNARQRALQRFKRKEIQVLVATDVAARGIDIAALPQVINFDLPETPETYVHRIGRTGRAGIEGTAHSFCDREERFYLNQIHRLVKTGLEVVEDHPYAVESAPLGDPRGQQRQPNRRMGGGGGSRPQGSGSRSTARPYAGSAPTYEGRPRGEHSQSARPEHRSDDERRYSSHKPSGEGKGGFFSGNKRKPSLRKARP